MRQEFLDAHVYSLRPQKLFSYFFFFYQEHMFCLIYHFRDDEKSTWYALAAGELEVSSVLLSLIPRSTRIWCRIGLVCFN